jgi:hypothetical protein
MLQGSPASCLVLPPSGLFLMSHTPQFSHL